MSARRHAILFVLASSYIGQVPVDDPARNGTIEWQAVLMDYAKRVRIRPAESPSKEFKLLSNSLLRFAAATTTVTDGAVFLWTQEDGRPAVIGYCHVWPSRNGRSFGTTHRLHSLTDEPFTATTTAAVWRHRTWKPASPGLEWKPAPDAPIPSDSAKRRSFQARQLSRRFRAHSIRNGERSQLRLLSKPLHQYEGNNGESTFALFAFCEGTVPNVILAIESRKTEDGYRWHYACARFAYFQLFVQLDNDDADVWSVPTRTSRQLGTTSPCFAAVENPMSAITPLQQESP